MAQPQETLWRCMPWGEEPSDDRNLQVEQLRICIVFFLQFAYIVAFIPKTIKNNNKKTYGISSKKDETQVFQHEHTWQRHVSQALSVCREVPRERRCGAWPMSFRGAGNTPFLKLLGKERFDAWMCTYNMCQRYIYMCIYIHIYIYVHIYTHVFFQVILHTSNVNSYGKSLRF